MPPKNIRTTDGIIVSGRPGSKSRPSEQIPITRQHIVRTTQATNQLSNIDRLLEGRLRFAFVRPAGGIGDVLMSFPAIKVLKQKYNAEITYVTSSDYLNGALIKVCQHNPYIDYVVDTKNYDPNLYDAIIDFYCPCKNHEVPLAPPIHRIDLFARHCGLTIPLSEEDRGIDYIVTKEEQEWAREWFAVRKIKPSNCVIVQPCASNERRSYPPRNFRDAVTKLSMLFPDLRFLVVQHDSDFDKNTRWDHVSCVPVKNYHVSELAALISQVPIIICQDSALLHVAGAVGTNIIGLFGPTDYRARMYPNMTVICPAQEMPLYPQWYDTRYSASIFWNPLTVDMLVDECATEIKKLLTLTSNTNMGTQSIRYDVL